MGEAAGRFSDDWATDPEAADRKTGLGALKAKISAGCRSEDVITRIRALVAEQRPRDLNEADTRSRVIDLILREVLAWPDRPGVASSPSTRERRAL